MKAKLLVVSAVNLVEGGTLAVLRSFLRAAREELGDEWEILAIVHKSALITINGIGTLEYPRVKERWHRRIWFEYWRCRALSRRLNADLWVSLHDTTPWVRARRQAVYCHNPLPFYRLRLRDVYFDPKLLVLKLVYKWLYRINVGRNAFVIVQQDWLRGEFARRLNIHNSIVAHPVDVGLGTRVRDVDCSCPIFLYPALPRPYKNFELVCEAVRRLEERGSWNGEVRLTVDGSENAYARYLIQRYGKCRGIRFIGLQNAAGMSRQYAEAHCLIFPSRCETWGLPITEAKEHGLAILAADLPYAHEAVGTYKRVNFFDVHDPEGLALKMRAIGAGRLSYSGQEASPPDEPFARNWRSLISLLAHGL